MQIEKKFLNFAPESEAKIENVLEVTVREQGEKIKELEEKIEKADFAIKFLAEFEKTFLKAIAEEDDLLEEASQVTKNETQRSIFLNIARTLNRVVDRISNDVTFKVNKEEMKIEKIVKKNE